MEKKYKILLVDDEPDIIEFIRYNLIKEGFEVYHAENGIKAIEIAKQIEPHLIILDVMMPGMDGIETCSSIRQISNLKKTVITFLTARGEDYSQIAGFEAGADDYITKPIKPKVLISRINALLKRFTIETEEPVYEMNGKNSRIIINREKYLVTKNGQDLILPRKEFELLALLVSKPEKVFTREEIYQLVWGSDIIVGDRTIDVHIRKLREKIGEDHIVTIKGVGYKFMNE
ncbi:MAG: DNA-binding response regulator [Bacteroidetes bacterium GWF2_38_335]|nr:MAG: DNA-binding response regulator [Bacteroidetes bacterium GWF2_38_335]OFY80896.1 MAG: DNA-binding response regulator [Bacteroidetes bacterium RIFOXYA12_FULL_38_20]HBS84945.1 DNA-binding response regulator [Bacteroidales bacterium]